MISRRIQRKLVETIILTILDNPASARRGMAEMAVNLTLVLLVLLAGRKARNQRKLAKKKNFLNSRRR